MGKLAKYGAIAGGGKAVQENVERKREERLIDIEQMRRERLAKWQEKHRAELQEDQQSHQMDVVDTQHTQQQELAGESREFQGQQGDLERQNRLNIAMINASGRSGSTPEWMKQRFDKTTQDIKNEFGETIDQTMGVFDKKDGLTYVLRDSVWQLPNSEIKIPPSDVNSKAIDRLAQNYKEDPMEMYNFLQTHGWLPVWIFSGQNPTLKGTGDK